MKAINTSPKQRICYLVSFINKSIAFEWISENLSKEKYELSFILYNTVDTELERYLNANKIPVERINYSGKKDYFSAFIKTYKSLKRNKIDTVHAHLFDANIIGIVAAYFAGVKRRVHTRHHGTWHHVHFPHAVYYDKLVNRLSTHIIAISKNLMNVLILRDKANPKKIQLVHHGFKLELFENISEQRIKLLQEKYNPTKKQFVFGVIGRYIDFKGIQFVVPAFKKILELYPDSLLIMANGIGKHEVIIKKLLQEIPKENYVEVPFEKDIFAFYKLFTIFIHAPIDIDSEAFGQTYVEALASEIPSVFTLAGVANEFIIDRKNALVVPFQDSEKIVDAACELIENKELRDQLVKQGKKDVHNLFTLDKMIQKLETLYDN
jgi:glycosyltransferase involved in cell wall biosynthesis